MRIEPAVLAVGLVDERRVAGSSGVRAEWRALGLDPPGDGRAFRALFHRPDATFRRLDRASRALVLAAEAAGIGAVLPREARDETALVVETERGSLDADLEFADSLQPGPARGALFAYTLPSASLGEVALRHGLRGPAICLSIYAARSDGARSGEALAEARRLLEDEEARFAVAGCVEALASPRDGLPGALRAIVALIGPAGTGGAAAAVGEWPAGADPFGELARAVGGAP